MQKLNQLAVFFIVIKSAVYFSSIGILINVNQSFLFSPIRERGKKIQIFNGSNIDISNYVRVSYVGAFVTMHLS